MLERRGEWDDGALAAAGAAAGGRQRAPSCTSRSATCSTAAARYDEAVEAYQRAMRADPGIGDDVYFKLGNIHYKRMERDRGRAAAGGARWSSNPANAVVRTNLELVEHGCRMTAGSVDLAPRGAPGDPPGDDAAEFEELSARSSASSGFNCQIYKEQLPAPPHRGAHAGARRPHVLRLRGAPRRRRREYERLLDTLTINVTKFFRNWET